MTGSLFKRCGCSAPTTGPDGKPHRRSLGCACPRIRRPDGASSSSHGTWWFSVEVPSAVTARRAPIRHDGYRTRREAAADQSRVLALLALAGHAEDPAAARAAIADTIRSAWRTGRELPEHERVLAEISAATRPDQLAVGQWLHTWLDARQDLRAATALSYRSLTDRYLVPLLGDIPLADLRADHIRTAIETLLRGGEPPQNAIAPDSPTPAGSCPATTSRCGRPTSRAPRQVHVTLISKRRTHAKAGR